MAAKRKRARKASTRTKASKRKRPSVTAKRKPPVGAVKPTGGRATRAKGSQRKVSKKRTPVVKSARKIKPAKPLTPTQKLRPLPKPKPKVKGKLSKHPEAARSRRRRGLQKEREREAQLKREAANRKRRERERKRKKKTGGGRGPSETELARGWLEMIRERLADVFGTTLDITIPLGGAAREEDKERERPAIEATGGTPWMIVGRYDPTEEINYQILAAGLSAVENDLIIEASVNPDRLSQIRILFTDVTGGRGEGDNVLSHIGSWGFILGDAIGDLVGSDLTAPDEGSLAARYKETTVPVFYIFFSSEMVRYSTAPGFAPRTQEVKLR